MKYVEFNMVDLNICWTFLKLNHRNAREERCFPLSKKVFGSGYCFNFNFFWKLFLSFFVDYFKSAIEMEISGLEKKHILKSSG